jgi:hypothetical protein
MQFSLAKGDSLVQGPVGTHVGHLNHPHRRSCARSRGYQQQMPLTRVNWFRAGLSNHCTIDQSEIANSGRRLRSPVDACPIGWDASFDVTPIWVSLTFRSAAEPLTPVNSVCEVRGHQSPVQSGGNGNRSHLPQHGSPWPALRLVKLTR